MRISAREERKQLRDYKNSCGHRVPGRVYRFPDSMGDRLAF